MATQHIDTLIIGAGQAGLATGYHLKQLGREILIVDGNERVGDNWRCHWDSLRLFTPAKYDGLPGMPFPGDPWSFPGKDDVADYLETYALEMELPVRLQTRVDRLEARPGGGFTAHLGAEAITSDNVVVATGTRGRTPHVPELAGGLAPSIRQLHSTEYQRPSQISDGPVLVVGASHSGCEIAHELAEHLPVTLCGRYTGNEPFAPGSGWDRMFTPLLVLVANHVLTRRTPPGRKLMAISPQSAPRSPDGTDQAATLGRTRCPMAGAARDRGVPGRETDAGRRYRPGRHDGHLVHGVRAALRVDRPAHLRRAGLAA